MASPLDVNEKTRVQIDLFAKELERMNSVMAVCDLATRKDLFNTALTLLYWAVKEVRSGRQIASIDPSDDSDIKVLSMSALDSAAMSAGDSQSYGPNTGHVALSLAEPKSASQHDNDPAPLSVGGRSARRSERRLV